VDRLHRFGLHPRSPKDKLRQRRPRIGGQGWSRRDVDRLPPGHRIVGDAGKPWTANASQRGCAHRDQPGLNTDVWLDHCSMAIPRSHLHNPADSRTPTYAGTRSCPRSERTLNEEVKLLLGDRGWIRLPGAVVSDEGVEDVGAASGQADGGRNRPFTFVSLALEVVRWSSIRLPPVSAVPRRRRFSDTRPYWISHSPVLRAIPPPSPFSAICGRRTLSIALRRSRLPWTRGAAPRSVRSNSPRSKGPTAISKTGRRWSSSPPRTSNPWRSLDWLCARRRWSPNCPRWWRPSPPSPGSPTQLPSAQEEVAMWAPPYAFVDDLKGWIADLTEDRPQILYAVRVRPGPSTTPRVGNSESWTHRKHASTQPRSSAPSDSSTSTT